MGLRDAKKQAVSKGILRAAWELFLEKGLDETSVEEIAARAGISRASLFNYYRGKAAIVEALAAGMEPRLLQLVSHYLEKPLSTGARIQALFEYAGKVLCQTTELSRLLLVHGSRGAGFPALEAEFTRLVRDGQRGGDVRADLPAAQLAEPVYLAFMASVLGWCRDPDLSLEEQLTRRATFVCGLLAVEG